MQGSSSSRSAGNPATEAVVVDVDSDSGDEEVFSRELVKNLVWIERSERHKSALEFWRRESEATTLRQDVKRNEIRAVNNEMFQLIGFYSVFQGVLLTVVSQSNLLHCNNEWSVLSLSGLASFVTLIGICQKFWTIWELERTIESEKEFRQVYVTRTARLIALGEKFRFHLHAKDAHRRRESRHWILFGSIFGVIVVLLLFSGTFLASIHRILCHPGKSNLPGR